jgi:hypothetical protein
MGTTFAYIITSAAPDSPLGSQWPTREMSVTIPSGATISATGQDCWLLAVMLLLLLLCYVRCVVVGRRQESAVLM